LATEAHPARKNLVVVVLLDRLIPYKMIMI